MNILVDENNNIVSFAEVGDFEGGVEISNGIVPNNFLQEFKSGKFKYIDGKIVYNKGFQEYVESQNVQQAQNENAMLKQEIASLNKKVDELTTMISELIAQNSTPPE